MTIDGISAKDTGVVAFGVPEYSGGERSESERSGGAKKAAAPRRGSLPEPEVPAVPQRRRFTADYKAGIVREADACREEGAVGTLLRREVLYSSQLTTWRRQYRSGALTALKYSKRGRKQTRNPFDEKVLAFNGKIYVWPAVSNRRRPSLRSQKILVDAGDSPDGRCGQREQLMDSVKQYEPRVGTVALCRGLGPVSGNGVPSQGSG